MLPGGGPRRLDRLLSDRCTCEDELAVEYDGWNGSVHTFRFDSVEYARRFRRSNAGKVLD